MDMNVAVKEPKVPRMRGDEHSLTYKYKFCYVCRTFLRNIIQSGKCGPQKTAVTQTEREDNHRHWNLRKFEPWASWLPTPSQSLFCRNRAAECFARNVRRPSGRSPAQTARKSWSKSTDGHTFASATKWASCQWERRVATWKLYKIF